MNIHTITPLSILFVISSCLCMELEQATIKINHLLIDKCIKEAKQNTSNPELFSRRTKKMCLLQQLLNHKIDITFSNENINFWRHKDANITQNILHEELLSFLSYKTSFQKKITLNYTPFENQESLIINLHVDGALLHFTTTKLLNNDAQYALQKFLHEYHENIDAIAIKQIVTPVSSYAKATKDKQNSYQHLTHDQQITNPEDQLLQLPQEEQILFMKLPYNTQQLLLDIIFDKNDVQNSDEKYS